MPDFVEKEEALAHKQPMVPRAGTPERQLCAARSGLGGSDQVKYLAAMLPGVNDYEEKPLHPVEQPEGRVFGGTLAQIDVDGIEPRHKRTHARLKCRDALGWIGLLTAWFIKEPRRCSTATAVEQVRHVVIFIRWGAVAERR